MRTNMGLSWLETSWLSVILIDDTRDVIVIQALALVE